MTDPLHGLVVDDEPRIRNMLRRYLVEEGLKVSDAADGAGMRTVLTREAIDLVLLDLMMPGDGLSLARGGRGGFGPVFITALTAAAKSSKRLHKNPGLFAGEPFEPIYDFADVWLSRGPIDSGKPPRELRELCAGSLRTIPVSAARHMSGQNPTPRRLRHLW